MLKTDKIRNKSNEQIFMIFAKHPNFVAQILAEGLVRQKEDEKNLSSWVFDIITERCQSIKNNFTDEEREELLEKQQG